MKRLALCCDGTWNRADQQRAGTYSPTNVLKLALRIANRDQDGVAQVILYEQGVGTRRGIDRISGGAFGAGLEDNIYEAYRFLIANYEPGDEVFLFGFSRGAFTARSLAGLVRRCGLLRQDAMDEYVAARRLYRTIREPEHPAAVEFRSRFAWCGEEAVRIRFVGVWDTVGSLGIPLQGLRGLTRQSYTFHDTELSGSVQQACHALAIDERRAPFQPTTWLHVPKPGQTVEQAWFPGVHGDVGGGYPETGLSDVTLDWMLARAEAAGLALDGPMLAKHPLRPEPTGVQHVSRKGPYRLLTGIDRRIGFSEDHTGVLHPDPTQTVHPSALARWDADPGYRPPQLRAWLERTGDPRGAEP